MSIEMVRIPSETPNISNIDDFVGLRYAFGNQDGYILDKGNECSYTINGSIFKINSGRLVLQGIECDIDANGVEITVDNVSTKRYYSVYLQINLALNETKILSTYDTTTYPTIDIGDNLTQNTTGTARLVLYNFEVTNGVIGNVQKTIKQLEYTGEALKNYDITKGTIEQRLTNLGFKQGEVEGANGFSCDENPRTDPPFTRIIKRQGNYIICPLKGFGKSGSLSSPITLNKGFVFGKLPNDFYPLNEFKIRATIINYGDLSTEKISVLIKTNGDISYNEDETKTFSNNIAINIANENPLGYEGSPL